MRAGRGNTERRSDALSGYAQRVRYAAYGSNLHPARLSARTASATLVATAKAPGWALRFHKRGQDGSAKCNIVPADDHVHVAVYELHIADKAALDRIEGVGRGYAAAVLDVPGVGRCATYVAELAHVDDALLPFCWYHELVLRGARFHGFPEDYIAAIAALGCECDPDRARHKQHMALARSASAGVR